MILEVSVHGQSASLPFLPLAYSRAALHGRAREAAYFLPAGKQRERKERVPTFKGVLPGPPLFLLDLTFRKSSTSRTPQAGDQASNIQPWVDI